MTLQEYLGKLAHYERIKQTIVEAMRCEIESINEECWKLIEEWRISGGEAGHPTRDGMPHDKHNEG